MVNGSWRMAQGWFGGAAGGGVVGWGPTREDFGDNAWASAFSNETNFERPDI